MELAGDYPDVVIGSVGGGSNFSGLAFPFMPDKFKGKAVRFVAVEPEACPTLTRGDYLYDFGDTAGMTPLVKMYTLGHTFVPPGIHAGGLRYHGDAPLLCLLYHHKYVEAIAYQQRTVFDAALQFARTEGIIPAPEAAHAIRKAIDEALEAKVSGKAKTILFGLSGHGHFDLGAYEAHLAGRLEDFAYPEDAIKTAMRDLAAIQP
jgi:tryptophan synthase beta chain